MNEQRFRAAELRLWESVGVTPSERRVRLDRYGTTVRIQEVGEGPTVLFVHGGSNAGASWAPLIARLDGIVEQFFNRLCLQQLTMPLLDQLDHAIWPFASAPLIAPPLPEAVLSHDRVLQLADLALERRVLEHHASKRHRVRFDLVRLGEGDGVRIVEGCQPVLHRASRAPCCRQIGPHHPYRDVLTVETGPDRPRFFT